MQYKYLYLEKEEKHFFLTEPQIFNETPIKTYFLKIFWPITRTRYFLFLFVNLNENCPFLTLIVPTLHQYKSVLIIRGKISQKMMMILFVVDEYFMV